MLIETPLYLALLQPCEIVSTYSHRTEDELQRDLATSLIKPPYQHISLSKKGCIIFEANPYGPSHTSLRNVEEV